MNLYCIVATINEENCFKRKMSQGGNISGRVMVKIFNWVGKGRNIQLNEWEVSERGSK